jgi:hypothetical protein
MPRLDYFNNSTEARKEWYRRYRKKNRARIKEYNREWRRKRRQNELSTRHDKAA